MCLISVYFVSALLIRLLPVSCENILFLQTTPSKSHHIWNKQIFDRLFENGHNLTILSYEEEQSIPGKTFLCVNNFYNKIIAQYERNEKDSNTEMTPAQNIINMYDFYEKASRVLFTEKAIALLLDYPKTFKFDLIIHDFTMGQFLLGFVEKFGNPPLVSISAFNAPSYTTWLADLPLRVTTLPNYASSFGPQMSLSERYWNLFYWTLDYYHRQRIFMANEDRRLREMFGANSSSATQLEKYSDLILVNMDFSMDYYQPLPPNVIPVGGLHISRQEQIPPNIAEFIERPSKGVVLFSLGTNVKSEELGSDINRAILDTFANMPEYNFIWKHGDRAVLGSLPPNVLVQSWIPQVSIMSSAKIKLLISHGGLLSLQEAVWHGIPMVGIPFFADQYQNIDKLVRAGVALSLPLRYLNQDSLKETMLHILQDDWYHRNMLQRSKWFRNQTENPLDRAMYWIEKVIQYKGLLYLQSPANRMTLMQVYGTVLVIGAFITIALIYNLVKYLLSSVNKQILLLSSRAYTATFIISQDLALRH